MSALSEEFREARRLLLLAADPRAGDLEDRKLFAVRALGHAMLASASPGTATQARYDEEGMHGEQAVPDW